jgi:UDP-glucose 4-epimerase
MSKQKVLVTGGAGYIGSHTIISLIEAGYEPIVIDNLMRSDETLLRGIEKITNQKLEFHKGSCCDESFLDSVFEKHGMFNCVIHFAALKSVVESVKNPLLYFENNIGSLTTLLKVMERYSVKNFIFSSSCTVYGQPDEIPVLESAPFKKAESPYGETKQICEQILERVSRDFSVVSLRYFNPIGAHPSAEIGELPIGIPGNLVPFITQTAAGLRDKLTVFGNDYATPDGSCIRDYIHIIDLAEAHVKSFDFLQKNKVQYEVFNLGTGTGASVLELLQQFVHATGVVVPFEIGPRRPGDVEKVYANPDKANRLLNWSAKYSIEDALLHAWQWQKRLQQK